MQKYGLNILNRDYQKKIIANNEMLHNGNQDNANKVIKTNIYTD